jgi:hypothetical protein
MPLPVPKATKPPEIKTISVKAWQGGVVSAYDDGRTPSDGLRSSGNTMLDQDGTIRPRPSLALANLPAFTGTVLGEIFEFRSRSGLVFTNWNICLQNVAGTTNVFIAKWGDTTWTKCTAGVTFDNTAKARFCQIQDKVLVMNATDTLAYLDITTSTVTKFTAILDAGAPTVVNNGSTDITTGTKPFTIYYAVTANSTVGETKATNTTSIAVTTDRDFWDPTKHSLKVTWSAVTNAKSYNIYAGIAAAGAGAPTLYRITSGLSADSTTFIDDGSYQYQLINVAPTTNSTAGPKVSRGTVINGRVFLVGDTDHPFYVWNGGDPGFELDFSPSNGGGFSQVGNGTKEFPIAVKPFHQGKGDPGIFVLTQGTNGHGKRYILSADSVTYNNLTIPFYDVSEDNGTDGTDSPDGVITYNDALWYPSRDGFKTTGTKPQLQNILSTDRVSDTIQTDIPSLNNSSMSGCVGLAYEGRLYWAVPYASSTNNQIWVLDLDRKGAWMKPWDISADWMWLYNDNNGMTHFLVLSGNVVYEFTDALYTNDAGVSFSTSGNSGQVSFSKDGRIWARVLNVIYVLLRPQGTFQATVSGEGTSGAIAQVGSASFTPRTSVAGWDEPLQPWDTPLRAWDAITTVPLNFNSATQEVKVKVDKDLKWFSYGWITTGFGVFYNLSDVVVEYVEIGNRDV